eukprot:6492593-Amphidinium_carterae.1
MKGKLEEQKVGRKVNYRSIMRLHASEWSALPETKKDIFNRRALVLQDERRQAHKSQASTLATVAGKLSESIAETSSSINPSMSISASRLTHADLKRWESMLDTDRYTSSKCKKLRQDSTQTPAEIDAIRMTRWDRQSNHLRSETRGHSDLYMRVARAREHFATAIFVLSPAAETPLFFRFVYASLKPVQAHFIQLSELTLPPSSDESLRTTDPQWDEILFAWTYEWHDIVKEDIFVGLDPNDIGIYPCSCFKAASILTTRNHIQPLSQCLPEEVKRPAEPVQRSSTRSARKQEG